MSESDAAGKKFEAGYGVVTLLAMLALGAYWVIRAMPDEKPSPRPMDGSTVTMSSAMFGCRSLDDLDKVVEFYSLKKDKVAGMRFGSQHCITLPKGRSFQVDDSNVWHGAVCVRARGDTECYWTLESSVSEASK